MTKPESCKTKREYRFGDYCVCPDAGEGRGYWGRTVFFRSEHAAANGAALLYETDARTFDEARDFTGRVSVSDSILWMSSTKTYSGPNFASPAEYVGFLESLPPWPLTMAAWAWKEGTLLDCTRSSVVTYFGPDVARFAKCFSHLGEIKVSYSQDITCQSALLAAQP